MIRKILIALSSLLLINGVQGVLAEEVTLQTLLREIVNRKGIAEFSGRLPYKTLQASSYNRASVAPDEPGWFADADGVSCIRTEKNKDGETEWVLMEDEGPGAITKIWAVCFYYGLNDKVGANVKIYLDGSDEPTIFCNFFQLVMGHDFVNPPLASETTRAGNIYLPIPYAKGCKVTMDKKVFYNIIDYRSFPKGTKVKTFTMEDYNSSRALVDSVNQVLKTGCQPMEPSAKKTLLKPGQSVTVKLKNGGKSGAVQAFSVRMEAEDATQALRSTVLKGTFDGEETIWSPVGDFFNIGVGKKTYRMWERAVEEDGTMTCRWVMPYQKSGELTLENLGKQSVTVDFSVKQIPYEWSEHSMHFHATWRMDETVPGFPLFDYNLVKVEGRGLYVGDQFTVLNPTQGWWGEGDEKVYVDDDKFPSHFGTGTEDYYGWAGGIVPNPVDEFDEPFLANVRVASPNSMGYNTCTRTRVLDAIPFNKHLDFNIEASGSVRNSWFHMQYSTNAFWYACPGSTSNRVPLPELASKDLMTLEWLQAFNEKCKEQKYVFPGAVEAENLDTYTLSEGVRSFEGMKVWGELSGGAVKSFTLDTAGQKVDVRLTELFDKTALKVCLVQGNGSGEFDIMVNGTLVRNVDLSSEHSALATLDLGEFTPKDNSLLITFVCRRPGNLGIDYFSF